MDRRMATTTGRMLEHSFDAPSASASYLPKLATITPLVASRRRPVRRDLTLISELIYLSLSPLEYLQSYF